MPCTQVFPKLLFCNQKSQNGNEKQNGKKYLMCNVVHVDLIWTWGYKHKGKCCNMLCDCWIQVGKLMTFTVNEGQKCFSSARWWPNWWHIEVLLRIFPSTVLKLKKKIVEIASKMYSSFEWSGEVVWLCHFPAWTTFFRSWCKFCNFICFVCCLNGYFHYVPFP